MRLSSMPLSDALDNTYRCFKDSFKARIIVKALTLVLVVVFSMNVASEPTPISKEERQFLMALNVFGYPGSGLTPPELHETQGLGCIDGKGNLEKANKNITIDGFELSCMVQSRSKESGGSVHVWFPVRFSRYCEGYNSIEECSGSEAK